MPLSKTSLFIALYRQAEDYFFSSIASQCLSLSDDAHAYMTGVPSADLNLVYITKNTSALDTILTQCAQFYDHNHLPFVVHIPSECCAAETENILKNRGYLQTGQSVAMALTLDAFISDHVISWDDDMVIRTHECQLNDWMVPLIGAFDSPFEVTLQYAVAHESALRKKRHFYHFSLYHKEQPIASMTLSIHNDIARVDDVGVLPEFQRQGYGTSFLLHALSEAKKRNAHDCFLEASDAGLTIYQRLGFKPLFQNNIYSRNKICS